MSSKNLSENLKYGIRKRYYARCTQTGVPVNLTSLYDTVAESCGKHRNSIRKIVNCQKGSPIVATMDELEAFAQILGCTATELAAEAAERVVAV